MAANGDALRLQQGQRAADAGVASFSRDDKPLEQAGRTIRQRIGHEIVDRNHALRRAGGRIHDQAHRPARIERAPELASHLEAEIVAFDQAQGPTVIVDHGDAQEIGLGLETLVNDRAEGGGPDRRHILRKVKQTGQDRHSKPGTERIYQPLR